VRLHVLNFFSLAPAAASLEDLLGDVMVDSLLRKRGLVEDEGQLSVPTLGIHGNEAVMQLVTRLAAGLDHSPCITTFKEVMKGQRVWRGLVDGAPPWRRTTEPGMGKLIFAKLDLLPPRPHKTVAAGAKALPQACIFPSLQADHLKAARWKKYDGTARCARRTYYWVTAAPNKRVAVHRALCVLWEGPPPDGAKSHASHECDTRGCCNPRHLQWRTLPENVQLSRAYKKVNTGRGVPSPTGPESLDADLAVLARTLLKRKNPK
jgi:hypothetical protein